MPANLSAPPQRSTRTYTTGVGPVVGYPLSLAAHLDFCTRASDWFRPRGCPPNTPANTPLPLLPVRSDHINVLTIVDHLFQPGDRWSSDSSSIFIHSYKKYIIIRVGEVHAIRKLWGMIVLGIWVDGNRRQCIVWWSVCDGTERDLEKFRIIADLNIFYLFTRVASSSVLLICDPYTSVRNNERLTVTALYNSIRIS